MVFAVATPFFFIYFTQEKQWWAIIPAGILGSVGLTALVGASFRPSSNRACAARSSSWASLHIRNTVLAARHHPTEWAKFPALVFSGIALLTLASSIGINGGPLVLIAIGVIVLYTSLRPRRAIVS